MCAHCAVEVNTGNSSNNSNSRNSSKSININSRKNNNSRTSTGSYWQHCNGELDALSAYHCEPGSVTSPRSMFQRLSDTCVCCVASKVRHHCAHQCEHRPSTRRQRNSSTWCHCLSTVLDDCLLIKCTILRTQFYLLLYCLVPFLLLSSSCIISAAAHPSE